MCETLHSVQLMMIGCQSVDESPVLSRAVPYPAHLDS